MSGSSKMKELLRALEREGFSASRTKGGHVRVIHPAMDGCVFGPSTPSDHRGVKNLLATLKRKLRAANDQ
jgi:predicted RNA binding protein YcfA (HicA-like mRNA interferase family)